MPVPQVYNVSHYRGDTLTITVRLWDDVDKTDPSILTTALITAQARASATKPEVLAEFTTSKSGNTITLVLSAAQTQTLPAKVVYDVQLDWNADQTRVETVLQGTITFPPDVTRVPPAPDETMI
jgi:hypothetical protein